MNKSRETKENNKKNVSLFVEEDIRCSRAVDGSVDQAERNKKYELNARVNDLTRRSKRVGG